MYEDYCVLNWTENESNVYFWAIFQLENENLMLKVEKLLKNRLGLCYSRWD